MTQGGEHVVRDPEGWAVRRRHILANLQEVTGRLPDRRGLVPLDMQVIETVDLPGAVRKKISFASEPGDRVTAYLLVPKGLSGRVSGILCLHPNALGYASATVKAVWDNMRAVDLLRSLPEVDPERIGAIGHSLGGHNAIFTAVFDERIKVVVSSCGFTALARYRGGETAAGRISRRGP